jgi:hypothetical protein
MKILILIPLWKRPEVVELCFKGLQWFRYKVNWDIQVLAILCPYDPELEKLEKLCGLWNIDHCYYPNQPLGEKHNAGINYALQHFDFDYLMNFGSDDLIHPYIAALYRPYFDQKTPIFGINSLFFYDFDTKRTFFFKTYTEDYAIGAGRMISREVLDKMKLRGIEMYENSIMRSCDGNSANRIQNWTGIKNTVINCGKFPYIVDVKTATNINHITQIESHKTQIEYFPNDYLTRYYNI